MNIVSFDKEKVTLEFSSQEFGELWRAISTVDQEYSGLDQSMLRVSEERIRALADALGGVLKAKAERYVTDTPAQH